MELNDGQQRRFPAPGRTPKDDTAAVVRFYGLPKAFPAKAEEEARRIGRAGVPADAAKGRLDLRGRHIFTCDPESARDYDDALSIETARNGNRVLGVHIADVSHYVRPGSALDREAFRRGTSVYLCDRVIPMLPETLSNGVCSLVPGEDRLAFSVFMEFDRDGAMVSRRFAKSVIRSKARFTYEQVMGVISGGRAPKGAGKPIRAIAALAAQLRARRFAAGALDIEIPEAEVVLAPDGTMSELKVRPYDESHQMVEECMVAANEAVAKELWANGVKIVARLHEPPDDEKLLALRAELRGLGVRAGALEHPKVFAQFLKSIKSHPLYPTISMMVLRSMKRAVYDPSSIGHFGLAKSHYAHFTSPIRRYPDLTLHRQLADWILKRDARRPKKLLEKWAAQATEREEVAAEAERALADIKKYRFLQTQIDERGVEEYDAVVSKCMPFGCFVEVPSLAVSGLVHVSLLSHRYVRYNKMDMTLSEPGGRTWRPGDAMKVLVSNVDMDARRIDFAPVRDRLAHERRDGKNGNGKRGRKR